MLAGEGEEVGDGWHGGGEMGFRGEGGGVVSVSGEKEESFGEVGGDIVRCEMT